MHTNRRKFFGKLGLLAAAAVGVKEKADDAYKCVIKADVKEYTLKSHGCTVVNPTMYYWEPGTYCLVSDSSGSRYRVVIAP